MSSRRELSPLDLRPDATWNKSLLTSGWPLRMARIRVDESRKTGWRFGVQARLGFLAAMLDSLTMQLGAAHQRFGQPICPVPRLQYRCLTLASRLLIWNHNHHGLIMPSTGELILQHPVNRVRNPRSISCTGNRGLVDICQCAISLLLRHFQRECRYAERKCDRRRVSHALKAPRDPPKYRPKCASVSGLADERQCVPHHGLGSCRGHGTSREEP